MTTAGIVAVGVLRLLLFGGFVVLLAATIVDEFQSAKYANTTVLNATVTYGAYKTTVEIDGGSSTTTPAKCGSEGNDAEALNSTEVTTICTVVCTTKKVAVVAPVVLSFISVILLTACTGHGPKSPLYAPTSKARWRAAAWCGIIGAFLYAVVLVVYTMESGSGPGWGVCRFASDDTDAPTASVSFYLAAVGTGIVGVLSFPLLCITPPESDTSGVSNTGTVPLLDG